MTRLREDTELVLPEPPSSIETLGPAGPGLAVSRTAGPGQILVEGGSSVVHGEQRGPVSRVRIGSHRVGPLRMDLGSAANVLASPGTVRREWVGRMGSTLETIVAMPTLPLVAIQWAPGGPPARGTAGTSGPGGGEGSSAAPTLPGVSIGLAGVDDPVSYRLGSSSLVIRRGDADEEAVAVGVVPRPTRLEVDEEAEGGPTLRIVPAPGTATVLIAAGPSRRVEAAFAAAAHLATHARAADAGLPHDGLTLTTGVAEVDEGVLWARWRLAAALARLEAELERDAPPGGSDPLWAALAAVGCGDGQGADRGLRALERAGDDARAALVAAGIARTFGDARPALELARRLAGRPDGSEGRAGGRGSGNDGAEAGIARAALTTLAEALHGSASPELLAELKAAAAARSPGGPRRLPMVGGASASPSEGAWLASLLDGTPLSPAPLPPSASGRPGGPESPFYMLTSGFRTDPDRAWSEWRRRIAEGLADGPSGPGTWDPFVGAPAGGPLVPVTAGLLAAVAFGLLGLAPDAVLGRIGIAPRLPSHLTGFRAEGIGTGTTRISLTYERTGDVHRFVLDPTTASVPPTVVFAPAIAGTVRETRVDGVVAELDPRREGDRTVVPVQLPLDARRFVEIVTGRAAVSPSS